MPQADPRAALPTLDGVGPSCVGVSAGAWRTVLAFLSARFPAVPEADWRQRMAEGRVRAEDGRAVTADEACAAHRRLYYYREIADEYPVPFEARVLFQDAHLVVADKPHFLPVTPGGRHLQETLLVRLKRALGIDTLSPLHRLDRETAGLVLLSVRPEDRAAYHRLFRDRAVEKEYEAVAATSPALSRALVRRSRLVESTASFMQMCEVAGPPNAVTFIERIGPCGDGLARYRLCPETGQRHQLRVHMAALGAPIVGDTLYPVLQPDLAPGAQPSYDRPLQLLARRIAFTDPVTGVRRAFQSRLALSAAGIGHDVASDEGGARDD